MGSSVEVTRRIWLLRHAKSDWHDASLGDHERPLNKRGQRSVGELAATFRREQIRPDVALVSTARRAQETASGLGLELTADAALYNASAGDLLTRMRAFPAAVQSVLLVGYNPGMEDLASQLGDSDGMTTATLLAFDVDALTWADLDVSNSRPVGRWEHSGRS
ncbi:MAG: SixA phosphatase family protein [Actinomycetes bacterium]